MLNKINKGFALLAVILVLSGCNRSLKDVLSGDFGMGNEEYPVAGLRVPSSIVVCRSKQCAPAKISMSREYIYNSLLHLFENNNHQTALICQASPASRTCVENYITMPIRVGITPAYMYIDSVKITDVRVARGNQKMDLILNYNLTYNGQSPECTPSKSILFARTVNHVMLEDAGYNCKMTSIGQTTVKNVFLIDYIDLDYGYIGGYYSIGLSGPAYGGGTGYMLIRLSKTSYPLAPVLQNSEKPADKVKQIMGEDSISRQINNTSGSTQGVQIFPLARQAAPVDEEEDEAEDEAPETEDGMTHEVESGDSLSESIPE